MISPGSGFKKGKSIGSKRDMSSSYGPDGEIDGGGAGGGGAMCSNDLGNKEQEKNMKNWANNNYSKAYSLFGYNCKDFTVDVILHGD